MARNSRLLEIAQKDVKARLAPLRARYSQRLLEIVQTNKDAHDRANQLTGALRETLQARADAIWHAVERAANRLSRRNPFSTSDVIGAFDNLFQYEQTAAFEGARAFLEAVPGCDYWKEVNSECDLIRHSIEVEAEYLAESASDHTWPERFLRRLKGNKVIAGLVIAGTILSAVAAFADDLKNILTAGTEAWEVLWPSRSAASSELSYSIPQGRTFASIAEAIARMDGRSVDLTSCPMSLTGAPVAAGTINGTDRARLIAALALRLGDATASYTVKLDGAGKIYQITCR